MDCLLYIANGLNLVSYTVRDILHLRLLTLTAVTCLALYFGSRSEPLMEVVYWNLVFIGMNIVQLGRIFWHRYRPATTVASLSAPPQAGEIPC